MLAFSRHLPRVAILALILVIGGCIPSTWLPDSSGFVYVKPLVTKKGDNESIRSQLMLFDIKTKTSRVIVDDLDAGTSWPAVSPDGKRIAVARFTGESVERHTVAILIYDLNGKELAKSKELPWCRNSNPLRALAGAAMGSGNWLFWSPTEDKILVSDPMGAGLYDLTKDQLEVFDNAAPVVHGGSPFRPDGKGFMLVISDLDKNPSQLVYVDAAKGTQTVLDAKDFKSTKPKQPKKDDEEDEEATKDDPASASLVLPHLLQSGWDGPTAWAGFKRHKVLIELDTAKKTVRVPQTIMDVDLETGKFNKPGGGKTKMPDLGMGFDFAGDISLRLDAIEESKQTKELPKGSSYTTYDHLVAVNHKTGKVTTLLPKIPSMPLFLPSPDGNHVLVCRGSIMGPTWPTISLINKEGELVTQINFDHVEAAWKIFETRNAKRAEAGAMLAVAAKPTPEERTKAFEWFSSLGVPDLKNRKFVRAATGYSSTLVPNLGHKGDPVKSNTYLRGFLTEDKDQNFKVLSLSLTEYPFRKTLPNTPQAEEVSYEVRDLKKAAEMHLKDMKDSWNRESDWSPWGNIPLREQTQAFVLAWACWRNGLPEMAAQLFDEAAAIPVISSPKAGERAAVALQRLVAADLARTRFWRAVFAFDDSSISRSQLIKQFEPIAKYHADSAYHQEAKAVIQSLSQMVQEDAAHAKNAKPFNALSKQAQIAELIFQLRDQTEFYYSQPYMFLPSSAPVIDTLGGPKQPEEQAAAKLVAMGYQAVPQLLKHLDDLRFTRAVRANNDKKASHHVVRVSDCVLEILRHIAAQGFWEAGEGQPVNHRRGSNGNWSPGSSYTALTPTATPTLTAERKKRIQDWYADLLKKGEKQMLIEGASRGDLDSCAQSLRLLEKYADAAPAPILAGLKAAHDEDVKDMMLAAAHRIKGDAPVPALLAELKDGKSGSRRLLAADFLHERGRPEPLQMLLAYWQSQQPKIWAESRNRRGKPDDSVMDLEGVASFLGKSNKVEAIAALAKDLHKRPIELRYVVLSSFFPTPSYLFVDGPVYAEVDYSPEVWPAIERLLVAALDDRQQSINGSGLLNGSFWDEDRVCDAAANALAQYWAKRYKFEATALEERDREIAIMKNAWRKANGMAPLPVPAIREIAKVPDDKLRPLVDALLKASAEEQPRHQAKIEELGLGALPGVMKLLEKASGQQDKAILEKLSRRLACVVDEALIAEDSVPPSDELKAKLLAMKGKPFEPKAFLDLVQLTAKNLPPDVHGMRYLVYRAGDDTGIKVKIDLFSKERAQQIRASCALPALPTPLQRAPDAWRYTLGVDNSPSYWVNKDANLKELFLAKDGCRKHLEDACAAAPTEVLNVRLIMIPDCPAEKAGE